MSSMSDPKEDLRGRLEQVEKELQRIRKLYDQTIRYKVEDTDASVMHTSKAAEAVCRQLFTEGVSENPGNLTLEGFIEKLDVAGVLPKRIVLPLRTIQGYGNFAAHEQDEDGQTVMTPDYIQPCLQALAVVVDWYFTEAAKGVSFPPSSEAIQETASKDRASAVPQELRAQANADGNRASCACTSESRDLTGPCNISVAGFAKARGLTPAHIIRLARDVLKVEFRTPSALLTAAQAKVLQEHLEIAERSQPDQVSASTKTFDLGDGIRLDLALISAGTFSMGSPPDEEGHNDDEVEHEVHIARPLYVLRHPVTQEQYHKIINSNPSYFKGPPLPVEMVSWFDCVSFCEALGTQFRVIARLPTEAEWEYVCRAGTSTAFSCGSTITTEKANFDGKFAYGGAPLGQTRWSTTAVGTFAPNEWGLFDMHGNVWEWCSDWYGEYTACKAKDPRGPASGEIRILRGGSWFHGPADARSAQRDALDPGRRHSLYGFRIVIEV